MDGRSSSTILNEAAICIAAGITSLLDWLRFTWSLGCASANVPITSFAFMLVEVPLPV